MPISESPTSPSTSPSLLERACEGDSTAWQRIVRLYGPLVYNWARRTGLQPHDAADVTQDTFAAVAIRLADFDHDRQGATFRGWLWTITRNKAADFARLNRNQPRARGGSANLVKLNDYAAVDDEESGSMINADGSPSCAVADQQEIVRRALAILRSNFEATTWQAFWRTVVDDCSPDEVAKELSLSRWAVYKARSRVLQRLRSELSGLEELT